MNIPTLLWPSQAALTPKKCPYCGSGFVCPTPPDSQSRTGETTCGICTRTICKYREDGFTVPASLSRRGAATHAALCTLCGDRPPVAGRRICNDCRNQQDRDRERIRNGQGPRRWARDYDACVKCGLTTRRHNDHGVCLGCRDRSNERKHSRGALAGVAS